MLIEIKHRWSLEVLFSHDVEDNSMRLTVQAAVEAKTYLRGAYLRDAYLRGADLRDADLRDAYLRGADLRDADLRGAYLRDADLRGADLRDADLRDAYLRGADLRDADVRGADLHGADLLPIKADFIEVISRAPLEVPALIAALKEGRVDGSTYKGPCACLVGTIANTRGIDYRTIAPDASRPSERLFMNIGKGDTPETNQVSAIVLEWAQVWLDTQRAAFAPAVTSATE